jgi:hypothetical protein
MTISSWVYHSNFFYECLFDVHLDKLLDSIIKACDLRDILFIDRFYLFFFKKKTKLQWAWYVDRDFTIS